MTGPKIMITKLYPDIMNITKINVSCGYTNGKKGENSVYCFFDIIQCTTEIYFKMCYFY